MTGPLLLALLLATPTPGEGDELLRQVGAYEYGHSREPLVRLSEWVRESLADPDEAREMERRLLELVASDATVEAREYACRQLRRIGTAAAVPVLSRLLVDETMGDAALFALSSIPDPAAGDALSAALESSSGRTRIGLVQALAMRGTRHPAFVRLAKDANPEIVAAATWALGRTGTLDDAARLLAAREANPEAREAALAIAERSGDAGEPVFRQLLSEGEPALVRVAALQGIVRLRGGAARPDLAAALRSDVPPLQAEAIRLAAFGDSTVLIEAVPDLAPAARPRTLTTLGEAGVKEALPLMIASLDAADEGERTAALKGLGALGGPEHVPLLAQRASATTGSEQAAARAALVGLRGAGVDEALVAEIPRAVGGTKRELIRAAGQRNAEGAADALFVAATSSASDERIAALRALRHIAPAEAVLPLVGLLGDPGGDGERREAERALAAVLRRHPEVSLEPVGDAFDAATGVETRVSLVSSVGRSGRGDALPLLRRALASEEEDLQRAAIVALTEWPTPDPAPDLLAVARGRERGALQVLALRGYIRLVSTPSARAHAEVTAEIAAGLRTAWRGEEKMAALAALQKHPCTEALALARTLVDDPEVTAEATVAVESLENALSYRR